MSIFVTVLPTGPCWRGHFYLLLNNCPLSPKKLPGTLHDLWITDGQGGLSPLPFASCISPRHMALFAGFRPVLDPAQPSRSWVTRRPCSLTSHSALLEDWCASWALDCHIGDNDDYSWISKTNIVLFFLKLMLIHLTIASKRGC